MNIEHLGDATIDQLVNRGLVRDFADLYHLTVGQCRQLEGFGDKSAENLVRPIAASRRRGLARLLNALGIRLVGEHVARLLAAHFGSLRQLMAASVDELSAIRGVGPMIAESVGKFLACAGNGRMLQRLAAAGVTMVEPRRAAGLGLTGTSFVLTGALTETTRSEAVDLLELLGARVTGPCLGTLTMSSSASGRDRSSRPRDGSASRQWASGSSWPW